MAKEKKYNPVQAQHKADKARAIKKGTVNSKTVATHFRDTNPPPQARQIFKPGATRSSPPATHSAFKNKSTT
jgi:hypothetical protein